MAHSTLHMRNPVTGIQRKAPVGFSWTSLFFGPIPCCFRQDWKSAIIIFLLSIVLGVMGIALVLWILQGFFYNKYYLENLVKEGYQVEYWEGRSWDDIERNAGVRLTRLTPPA